MLLEYILAALALLAAAWTPADGLLPPGFPWAPGAAAASVLLSFALSLLTAKAIERRMRTSREDWAKLVNYFGRTTFLLRFAVLALFAGAVHAGGWGVYAGRLLGPAAGPGLREGVVLLPFLASWAGCALALSRVEGGEGGAAAFVIFRLRGVAAILGFLLLAGAAVDLLVLRTGLAGFLGRHPWLQPPAALAVFLAALSFLPFFLRALWPTRPLPDGELKRELLEFARREGFRFREIRLWETGGTALLNAAVAGLLPSMRIVFLTRALLDYLQGPEVLAVFAHEAGHAKGRHSWGFFFLAAGWAGFAASADGGFLDPGAPAAWWAVQAACAAAFLLLALAFSRRAERAADLYAARALGNPDLFRDTLARVAMLNGDTRSLRSVTHSSVGARIEFLARAAERPALAESHLRSVALWIGVAAAVAALGAAAAAPRFL